MITNSHKNSISILHVFGCMDRGGAETRTVELLHNIDRDRFKVDFTSLSGQTGPFDDEIRSLGSRVHYCKLGRGFAKRFTAILKKEEYDVVHSHVHFSSGYILRLAEKAGVRGRIAHFRSTHDGRLCTPRRALQRTASRWLVNRYSTHILAVGEGVMATLFGETWNADPRRHLIPNGVDTSLFSAPPDRIGVRREFGLPDDCPLVIHVGNFREPKNHPFLISVFHAMAKRMPAARLLLVGDNNNKIGGQIRTQIENMGVAKSVALAGSRTDVPRLLTAADVMVFPSKWEGLPGVVLEASAAGLPVVASDIPGVAELVPHLPGIECISIGHGTEEWAKVACKHFVAGRDPDERDRLRTCFAEGPYTMEKCAAATCSIWEQAAGKSDEQGMVSAVVLKAG